MSIPGDGRPDVPDDHRIRRRQFILGPSQPSGVAGWPVDRIRGGRHLTRHPDLAVTRVSDERSELTLLGCLLDPWSPADDDQAILGRLLREAGNRDAFLQALRPMGGRWAIVVSNDDDAWIVHDPCGLRQVCYAPSPDGTWCASEPGLIAAQLGLEIGQAARAYLGSLYYRSYREPWWPGDTSPFDDIRYLLPNHLLDLRSARPVRFWPREPRGRLDPEVATARAAELLTGIVAAAGRRFRLAIALTAGFDSRAIVAATRGLPDPPLAYTMVNPGLALDSMDAKIAARVAAVAGIAHELVACPDVAPDEIARIQRASVTTPNDTWTALVAGLVEQIPEDVVLLDGSCAEVARFGYAPLWRIDGSALARAENMIRQPLAIDANSRWLRELDGRSRFLGYDTIDLAYWELRMGKWLAASRTQFDLGFEAIAPFDCRELIETMLATDARYRHPPGYIAHRRLIEQMWPELLSVSVNPMSQAAYLDWRLRRQISRGLKLTVGFDTAKLALLRYRDRRRRRPAPAGRTEVGPGHGTRGVPGTDRSLDDLGQGTAGRPDIDY